VSILTSWFHDTSYYLAHMCVASGRIAVVVVAFHLLCLGHTLTRQYTT